MNEKWYDLGNGIKCNEAAFELHDKAKKLSSNLIDSLVINDETYEMFLEAKQAGLSDCQSIAWSQRFEHNLGTLNDAIAFGYRILSIIGPNAGKLFQKHFSNQ